MPTKSFYIPALLVVSLVLNGVAGGYYYAGWAKAQNYATQQAAARKSSFIAILPKDKRQIYDTQRRETSEAIREHYQQLRELRKQLAQLLGAEPFSEENYRKKLEEVVALQGDIQRQSVQPYVALAKHLDAGKRKQLADYVGKPRFYQKKRGQY